MSICRNWPRKKTCCQIWAVSLRTIEMKDLGSLEDRDARSVGGRNEEMFSTSGQWRRGETFGCQGGWWSGDAVGGSELAECPARR